MKLRRTLGLVAVLLLAACNMKSPPGMPRDAEAIAITTYKQAAAGDIDSILKNAAPEIRTPEARAGLAQVQAVIPKTPPVSERSLSWRIVTSTGGTQAQIIRQYNYADRFILSETVLLKQANAGPWRLQGFHLRPISKTEAEAAEFKLEGRSPAHYAILAGAVLSPLICLFGLVAVLRAPKFKRKWLFAILSLIGFTTFTFNWATGVIGFSPISVLLLGAGIASGPSPLDPWVISVALPLGAALAIWRAGKARRDARRAVLNPFEEAPRTEPGGS
ncbi:MAG TPA: hypothetical protein VEA44_17855 [Caulobacter sp.]|nr:hypothetical protein [Caulobacter sp.]